LHTAIDELGVRVACRVVDEGREHGDDDWTAAQTLFVLRRLD
jgi:hypothetical protein